MNKNSSNSSKDLGNTNTKSLEKKKQEAPAKRWCFTFNNYDEKDIQQLKDTFSSDKYVIGLEIGKEGTKHLQGYVNLTDKKRFSALKKINDKIHWEICKGNEESNINYCTKENNYITNMKIKKPLKILAESQLYDWQKDIIKIIEKEPDDRKIYWYWEPNGNMGKTTFSKYLSSKYGAIPVEGKKNDILYCCAEFESEIYIMDIERSMEDYISYGAIEKIKNGYYMCSKYESKPIIRNPPHFIIFANFEPDKKALSLDRWIIKRL